MNLAEKFNHDFENGAFRLFDPDGNQTYYEDSNGYWCKSEYDSNGNLTYYEDSNESWYKHKYDSNGNETYYENSDDGVVFDNRPTPSCNGKIVEIDGKKYELKEV